MKFGFDFGTTNSAISVSSDGVHSQLLPIDPVSLDPTVVRSSLYFYPRKLVIDPHTPAENIASNNFKLGEISYEGDFKTEIGAKAMQQYLLDNTNRKPGIVRKIFTGKWLKASISPEAAQNVQVPEHFVETDYGTGRLLYALKTGLKMPLYKGTTIFGKFFTLEQLINVFVSVVFQKAKEQINEDCTEIVCGRPVHFSTDSHKDKMAENRLREALQLAGFSKISFEFEPIGAAKHYMNLHPDEKKKIFVFDFGGGTLDTSIVESGEKPKILATDGVYIGGNLLNADIMKAKLFPYFGSEIRWGAAQLPIPNHVFTALESWYGIPNLNNPADIQMFSEIKYHCTNVPALERLLHLINTNLGFELYESIEVAKKQLSNFDEATIRFEDGPIRIEEKITKDEFEKIIAPRATEIEKVIFRTLKNARTDPKEIDVVIRTGGSSLIPLFEKMLQRIFAPEKIKLLDTFTSIASGLSLHSQI